MSIKNSPYRLLVAGLALLPALAGCSQSVDEGDDKWTEGGQSVEVGYAGFSQVVRFDDVETVELGPNKPVVYVDELVAGSGLVVDADGLWIDFVGADGFSPIGSCEPDMAPARTDVIDRGTIERGTRNLEWEPELDFEGCMFVKDVALIRLADARDELAGDDPDPDLDPDPAQELGEVEVLYGDQTVVVAAGGLAAGELDGERVVLLETILAASELGLDPATVSMDFEGSDGYRPTAANRCTDYLPVDGALAGRCGLVVDTSQLTFDPQLDVGGCARVKAVVKIYLADL